MSNVPHSSTRRKRSTVRVVNFQYRPWLLAALVLMAATLVVAREAGSPATETRAAVDAAKPAAPGGQRQREGTSLVDVAGHFKLTGDRATFYTSDGSGRYGGLENLNLERIALLVSENPNQLEWSVSGTITEYRGANYLLITRAILKSKVAATGAPAKRAPASGGQAPDKPAGRLP
jgi:hypothetical protein